MIAILEVADGLTINSYGYIPHRSHHRTVNVSAQVLLHTSFDIHQESGKCYKPQTPSRSMTQKYKNKISNTGEKTEPVNRYAIVRKDNEKLLGIHSGEYIVRPYYELAEKVNEVIEQTISLDKYEIENPTKRKIINIIPETLLL